MLKKVPINQIKSPNFTQTWLLKNQINNKQSHNMENMAPALHVSPMKHECVSGFGCGCGIRQFLKKVGAGAAGLSD